VQQDRREEGPEAKETPIPNPCHDQARRGLTQSKSEAMNFPGVEKLFERDRDDDKSRVIDIPARLPARLWHKLQSRAEVTLGRT
jgi:hypothetical protein